MSGGGQCYGRCRGADLPPSPRPAARRAKRGPSLARLYGCDRPSAAAAFSGKSGRGALVQAGSARGRSRPQASPRTHPHPRIARLRFSHTRRKNPLLGGDVHPLAGRRSGARLGDGGLFSTIAPLASGGPRLGPSPDARPSRQPESSGSN